MGTAIVTPPTEQSSAWGSIFDELGCLRSSPPGTCEGRVAPSSHSRPRNNPRWDVDNRGRKSKCLKLRMLIGFTKIKQRISRFNYGLRKIVGITSRMLPLRRLRPPQARLRYCTASSRSLSTQESLNITMSPLEPVSISSRL